MQSAESDEFNRKSLRQKNLGTHRRVTIYQYEASTGPIRSRFVAMHTSEVPILQRLRYRIDRILRFACSQGWVGRVKRGPPARTPADRGEGERGGFGRRCETFAPEDGGVG